MVRVLVCRLGAAGPNGQTLALSHLTTCRGKAASIPAAARPHCILHARDLGILAVVFGCAIGQLIWAFISRLLPNCTNFPFIFCLRRSPQGSSSCMQYNMERFTKLYQAFNHDDDVFYFFLQKQPTKFLTNKQSACKFSTK